MGSHRLLLPLALAAIVAGCANGSESSDDGDGSDADPTLLLKQYYDIVAPAASDCTGAGVGEWAPAAFDVPAGARWVRLEATFATGRVGLSVEDESARRIGFAAAGPPVVVVVEDVQTTKVVARAYACDGTEQTPVRVYATFRSAAP